MTSSSYCRRGFDDLGNHYLNMGDLNNALKCYSRARDYCTSAKHIVTMCLNIIKVSKIFCIKVFLHHKNGHLCECQSCFSCFGIMFLIEGAVTELQIKPTSL